jgi:enolase-phosphatase E1
VPGPGVRAARGLIEPTGVRVVLLDIEGTTTAVSFVYEVLFPFARARLREFLAGPAGADDRRALAGEHGHEADASAPPWPHHAAEDAAAAAAYAAWLMDRDRKSTALKALQGRIWEAGYGSGALRSHLYPDVRPALERWRAEGRRIAIFSSGSVLAQRLLFAHTPHGDLTPLIDGFFDTTTGPKREAESYGRIAAALSVAPSSVLFVSDVGEELDAARAAGLRTALCVRDGAPPAKGHPVLRTFDEVDQARR